MSTNKHIDKICIAVVVLSLVLTVIFMNGSSVGIYATEHIIGYENRLFDTSMVHTINIVMDDWDGFIDNCESEEYSSCAVVIDDESYKNVAIRAKGNTSLSSVRSMGSDRYSFKLEFDHYDKNKSYHGLDKVCLNNLIQDNTMMKDYLAYRMMEGFGVDAPLCSYVYITVNGEDWGLYLAVEGIEDSFLERNYGNKKGNLYKPDSMSFGAGRGNGRNFNFGAGFGNGNDDVKLKYIDDNPESYSNIFESAKSEVSEKDKNRLISSLKDLSEYKNLENVLDMEEIFRYFIVHNFVVNGDSYTGSMIHNYYLYEEDGKLSMIPWDYNLAFGTFMGGDASSQINTSIDSPVSGNVNDRPMLGWIFSSEDYINRYHELFEKFVSEWLDSGKAEKMIEDARTLIRPYVEKDPTKFCTLEQFDDGADTISKFIKLRTEAVKRQLNKDTTKIDTKSINLSAMGTMGGFGGAGGFSRENMTTSKDFFSRGSNPEKNENRSETDEQEIPEGFDWSWNFRQPGQNFSRNESAGPDVSGEGGKTTKEGSESQNIQRGFFEDMNPSQADKSVGFANNGQFKGFGNFGNGENYFRSDTSRISTEAKSWIYVGVSVFVLIIGLIIAVKKKSRV